MQTQAKLLPDLSVPREDLPALLWVEDAGGRRLTSIGRVSLRHVVGTSIWRGDDVLLDVEVPGTAKTLKIRAGGEIGGVPVSNVRLFAWSTLTIASPSINITPP